jgi:hypothetical protein
VEKLLDQFKEAMSSSEGNSAETTILQKEKAV